METPETLAKAIRKDAFTNNQGGVQSQEELTAMLKDGMALKFTQEPPNKAGYYYWTNFGEHTPTVMRVTKSGRNLYADNGEYSFQVSKKKSKEELWAFIPNPIMPDDEEVEPDSF